MRKILFCVAIFAFFSCKKDKGAETAKKDTMAIKQLDSTNIEVSDGLKKIASELKENAKNAPQRQAESLRFLPGLTAVDVYLNFTNLGFSKTVSSAGGGVEYTCELTTTEHSLKVEIIGEADNKLNRIRGTAQSYSDSGGEHAKQFLSMLASLTYKGASPQQARNWASANIGKNTSTTIAGVTFILSSSGTTNMLTIEPAE